MRIRILSDLHLECAPWTYVHAEVDVIVLAGDIADRTPVAQKRLADLMQDLHETGLPVVYVLGNHEGYADWIPRDVLRDSIRCSLPASVHLLDRGHLDVGGYRIVGCTLWTDFAAVGSIRRRGILIDQDYAMHAAGFSISDFNYLCEDAQPDRPIKRITPGCMATWHAADRAWLDAAIATSDRPTIVVTHFLPGPGSVAPHFRESVLTPYFAPDVRHLLRDPVRLWIHGHTHVRCDYPCGPARVVCNPRGYAGDADSGFDSMFTVTL